MTSQLSLPPIWKARDRAQRLHTRNSKGLRAYSAHPIAQVEVLCKMRKYFEAHSEEVHVEVRVENHDET